jgi:hypothetical protein
MMVFWKQLQNDQHYFEALAAFCSKDLDRGDWIVLKNLAAVNGGGHCPGVFLDIREKWRAGCRDIRLDRQRTLAGYFPESAG